MKTFTVVTVALFVAVAGHSQPVPFGRPLVPMTSTATVTPGKEPVNYLIRVDWKGGKEDPKFLEVTTADGQFSLDTIQTNSVKINDRDIPVTLKFTGTLTAISDEKGMLQLFLGRTVPYVTGSAGPQNFSSYTQLSVGLQSSVAVTFGKPLVIQNDESGEISILVKRMN